MYTIGVLALQGDFIEHESMLRRIGAGTRQVRTAEQLRGLDGLIIPGGESTTFCRLIDDFKLLEPLRSVVSSGVPTWGTCAGMILLAKHASDLDFPTLQAIDIEVQRNAYGRQVDSFEADIGFAGFNEPFHAIFIRAPVLKSRAEGVDVLASVDGVPVALRQGSIMVTSFHPELTEDPRIHSYFLDMARSAGRSTASK
jgi:5'-phosphate synthase pdxT subunit